MFLPNTHHVFTQYTVKYVMKPVEYMAGENLTENRGKTRPYPELSSVPVEWIAGEYAPLHYNTGWVLLDLEFSVGTNFRLCDCI